MGIELIPFELPKLPLQSMRFILMAEAAAAFDELTRSDKDDLLVRQSKWAWPNSFRQARFIPAVVIPNGFDDEGNPTSITLVGSLFDEGNLLRAAKSLQDAFELSQKTS